MTEKSFTKEEWSAAVTALAKAERVIAPVKNGSYALYKPIENGVALDFVSTRTRLSPKNTVFPQSERMFEYSLDPADEQNGIMKEAEKDFSPQTLIGVRPCDAMAFQLVQVNFDTPEYKDPWWTRRYESTTFVGVACNEPCASCFCTSVNCGPHDTKGLDVLVTDLGDGYFARALTEKGEAVLGKLGGTDAKAEQAQAAEKMAAEAEAKVRSKVEIDNLAKIPQKDLFEAEFWKTSFEGCLNCGACTYSCPTCWCFDIQDETRKGEGDRIRNWDSCMFPLFTKHGMGHNPRGEKYQRTRQRFMHKLKYYLDKNDNGVLCVGCGRCVDVCPVNIDIRQVAQMMNSYKK